MLGAAPVPPHPASDGAGLGPGRLVPDGTDELDPAGDRRLHPGPFVPEGEVDRILGHPPVGGQLAAGDRGQSGRDPGDGVLARHLRRLTGGGLERLEQGAQAGVRGEDVVAGEPGAQHRVGLVEDVVDVGRGGDGSLGLLGPGGVGGADHPVVGPRDDEQHRLLGAQEQAGASPDPLLGDDDVHPLRGQHLEALGLRTGQALGLLGPHAGGVDDVAGPDGDLPVGLQVVQDGPGDRAALADEVDHPGPGSGQGTVRDGGTDQVDDQPGVIDPGVVEADRAGQPSGADVGEDAQCAGLVVVALDRHVAALEPGDQVVQADAEGTVAALDQRDP
ncbi:hypothetical protein SDC9_112035 [bioreactor metagenome]|uniref:Uncharacterized protein n=1 Tax=bioreactor metagenome TaxID=1076179 RepID=A0A645BPJ1_9ZZZZ